MVPGNQHLAKWLFRALSSLESGVPIHVYFSYLCREQFWGRAVRASRDSLNPGRFLFVVKNSLLLSYTSLPKIRYVLTLP